MALTFRQLRYFLVLAEELHFGRAARRLHISQPPLSASLRQLEEELGVQLLERSSKHVALTAAGELFQRQARRLLGELEDTQELVRRVARSPSGLLRIGFTPAMIFRGLPDVLTRFQQRHPGITVHLRELNSAAQLEALGLGRIDVGFIHALPLPTTVASLTIADEEFVACVPRNHALSLQARVSLRDLVGEPLIMFDRALAPHYYDRIVGLFRVADIEPTVRHEVSHWLTIIALIAQGVGVSLVPKALAGSGFADVTFLPLLDVEARHKSHCIWRPEGDDIARDLLLGCLRERLPTPPNGA